MYTVYRLDSGVKAVSSRRTSTKFSMSVLLLLTLGVLVSRYGMSSFLAAKQPSNYFVPVAAPTVSLELAAHTTKLLKPLPQPEIDVPSAVQAAINAAAGQSWSVSVYDISGQRFLAQVNDTRQMGSASLYKLYAAYALTQKLPSSQWATVSIGGHTARDCVDLMLRVSDNDCGMAVAEYVGWSKIDKYAHAASYNQTQTNHIPGPMTTANDTARFMSDLYQGKLFDADTTAFVLDSLARQSFRAGIPASCAGCTVYNKTGNTDAGLNHDAGVVVINGHAYAIVIMSDNGGSAKKIASITKSITDVLKQP